MNPRCNMTFVIVMLVVNVLIAWLNAYTAGTVWHDAKKEGGMLRFMAWSAAILSAIGFSQPILLAVTIGGQSWFAAHPELGVEHVKFAKLVVSLWYLLVILPDTYGTTAFLKDAPVVLMDEATAGLDELMMIPNAPVSSSRTTRENVTVPSPPVC